MITEEKLKIKLNKKFNKACEKNNKELAEYLLTSSDLKFNKKINIDD